MPLTELRLCGRVRVCLCSDRPRHQRCRSPSILSYHIAFSCVMICVLVGSLSVGQSLGIATALLTSSEACRYTGQRGRAARSNGRYQFVWIHSYLWLRNCMWVLSHLRLVCVLSPACMLQGHLSVSPVISASALHKTRISRQCSAAQPHASALRSAEHVECNCYSLKASAFTSY